MFVWVFHRISGVLLVALLAAQLITGFFQASASSSEAIKIAASLHRHAALNSVLVFCVIFHALYGLRTILMDLGIRREKLLFWGATALGCLLFVAFLVGFVGHLAS